MTFFRRQFHPDRKLLRREGTKYIPPRMFSRELPKIFSLAAEHLRGVSATLSNIYDGAFFRAKSY